MASTAESGKRIPQHQSNGKKCIASGVAGQMNSEVSRESLLRNGLLHGLLHGKQRGAEEIVEAFIGPPKAEFFIKPNC